VINLQSLISFNDMTKQSLFTLSKQVPGEYRANFLHLYLDIAWFGVLSGSAIAFVGVFAARQGANALQIGLLNAGPAVVNLMVTMPASKWLQSRPISRSVFWTAVFNRIFYLAWIFLPSLLLPQGQIWALITLTMLMSVPGTGLAVGFNALFAGAVPLEWRGYVAGLRNALLAMVYILVSLLCGWLLNRLPFPLGYQVVFGLGFLGAAMSTVHLWFVRPHNESDTLSHTPSHTTRRRNLTGPGTFRTLGDSQRQAVGLRFFTRVTDWRNLLQVSVVNGRYGQIIATLFFFHFTQFLAIPLFPLYWVNNLHLTDQNIGWGTALFYTSVLLGSTQLARLTERFGNYRLLVTGAIIMSLYPGLTAMSRALPLYLFTSVVGGIAWSLVGGVIANYLLENIPEDNRPAHLAWYNLALNAAILLGSLGGPAISAQLGLVTTLSLIAAARFLAAMLILTKGREAA